MKRCFFLFFIIIGCENIDRVVSIDKLIVYKTSRDSTYFFKEKPFSGEVYQNDNEGNKIRSFNLIDGKLSGIYEEFFSGGKTRLFIEMDSGKNPRDIKFVLAEELVDRFHNEGDGEKCKDTFLKRFQKGQMPDDIESIQVDIEGDSILLVNLLKDANMIASVSEGNRLIEQGGIKINSEKVEDQKLEVNKGSENIYQVGKRKFLKIKV